MVTNNILSDVLSAIGESGDGRGPSRVPGAPRLRIAGESGCFSHSSTQASSNSVHDYIRSQLEIRKMVLRELQYPQTVSQPTGATCRNFAPQQLPSSQFLRKIKARLIRSSHRRRHWAAPKAECPGNLPQKTLLCRRRLQEAHCERCTP
jgi:hypothetical protein